MLLSLLSQRVTVYDTDESKKKRSSRCSQLSRYCSIRKVAVYLILFLVAFLVYGFWSGLIFKRRYEVFPNIPGAVLLSRQYGVSAGLPAAPCDQIDAKPAEWTQFHAMVPNIVHYVWFTDEAKPHKMTFLEYLSFRSVATFQCPFYIVIHGNGLPSGDWWRRALTDIPNIFHVFAERPKQINGINFADVRHVSDVIRIDILHEYGGVYLDPDVLLLKSLDDLRHLEFSIGHSLPTKLNNGIIVAKKGAAFLSMWRESYLHYTPSIQDADCCVKPFALAKQHPDIVYVNEYMFPPWHHVGAFEEAYWTRYDWQPYHSSHFRDVTSYKLPTNPEELDGYDCAAGEMMRHVYYGSAQLRSANTWNSKLRS